MADGVTAIASWAASSPVSKFLGSVSCRSAMTPEPFASGIILGEAESTSTSERDMENSFLRNDAVFPPALCKHGQDLLYLRGEFRRLT